jgi:hypothetical protein
MAKISLGDLQKEADKRYSGLIVEDVPGGDVVLLSSLRLPKDKKIELDRIQQETVDLAKRLELDDLSDEERQQATENPMYGGFCGSSARTTLRPTGCSTASVTTSVCC